MLRTHAAFRDSCRPITRACGARTLQLFDGGLVTIEDDLTLCISKRLRGLTDRAVAEQVAARHGQKIIQPTRFYPDPACLRWRREHVFEVA